MLGMFNDFCRFLINSFSNATREPNSLDPDQARQNVGPDLYPNCLQRLSSEDNCRQKIWENTT